jgi:hypothetical protein
MVEQLAAVDEVHDEVQVLVSLERPAESALRIQKKKKKKERKGKGKGKATQSLEDSAGKSRQKGKKKDAMHHITYCENTRKQTNKLTKNKTTKIQTNKRNKVKQQLKQTNKRINEQTTPRH